MIRQRHINLALLAVLTAVGLYLLVYGYVDHSSTYIAQNDVRNPSVVVPSRIEIPRIGVNTPVQHVGVGEDGNMKVPNNYTDTAWYDEGYIPGQRGNAVIAGHFDDGNGDPAVFFELEELQTGDEIVVYNEHGDTLVFEVEEISIVDRTDAPLDRIFGPSLDNTPRLNLITCDGDWVDEFRTYSDRLIVYTKLKSS